MVPIPLSKRLISGDLSIPFYFSIANFILLTIACGFGGYGIFRDEFYYLACADHLALGYVDHPPLSIYLLKLHTSLFGDSMLSIRLLPAFCSALTIWFTGRMCQKMGGGKMATLITCFFAFSPGSLVMSSFVSMNSIELLSWTLAAYVIIEIINTGEKKYWIILGVILGLGLLNKIGVLFLGAGIFVGLLFTPMRRWLSTPWPYVAGLIAFLLFVPYIVWNIQHDMAHLEFIRNASSEKYKGLNMLDFVTGQFLVNHPVATVIWGAGLLALFLNQHLLKYRILGFMYLVPFFIFLFNGTSKEVYLLPAYGMLWAASGVWYERMFDRYRKLKLAVGIVALLWFVVTIIMLPLVLPVLSVDQYIAHSERLGFKPESSESKELAELPQFYADMFGWEEKANDVSKVFRTLTADEQRKCAIVGNNYGRCASIDYYSEELGLPKTIGTHNSYWIWGPRLYTGEVMIILGGDLEDHVDDFNEVKLAAVSDCHYCMPYEDQMNIFVCKGLKADLREAWGAEKHYD